MSEQSIPKPDLSTQETRDFWKSVFTACITCPHVSYTASLNSADQAVADMLARIPGDTVWRPISTDDPPPPGPSPRREY
jgi:hypothetical protein